MRDRVLRPLQTSRRRHPQHRHKTDMSGMRPQLGETPMNTQLQLDLEGSHDDATTAFREWLLSLPPTPWSSDE